MPLARWLIGLVLIAAAVLKASDTSGIYSFSDNRVLGEILYYAIIHVELALAACCLSGVAPRVTRAALAMIFSGFALYGTYLALSGAESCGCFGPVKVSPWWTVILDVVLLGLLAFWLPGNRKVDITSVRRQSALFLTGYATAAIAVTPWLVFDRPVELQADSVLADGDGVVILEPEHWKGRKLPIVDHLDIGGQLTTGEWVILLHNHNCPKCQASIQLYEELSGRLLHNGRVTRVALIEIPPYAADGIASPATLSLSGRLSDERDWFVQTPIEIRLRDGIVVDVNKEL